ncbi:hypothetical protein GCM10007389_36170 [Pontibacter akesuensis]|nr:hypothetical protein GCM10007389_36170 [Pontibacter akesuensis]
MFALLGLYPASQALAQKVAGSKQTGAEAVTLKPSKVSTSAAARPAKAESITAEPSKANAAAAETIAVAPSAVQKQSTTISIGGGTGKELSKAEIDSLVDAGVIKIMTHEEMLDMKRVREEKFLAMVNKPAPAFTATDLNGKTYTLEQLKGKTVVLNFWFIGCKPCVLEMPHLNEVVAKYKPEEVVFLAFALDQEPDLRQFLEKHSFNYNIVPDAGKTARDTFGVNAFPTSMVINKAGVLQSYLVGYSEDVGEQLTGMIEKARQHK